MLALFKNRPATFGEWVASATKGLCDEARERIAVEMRAHYDEALEAALAEGPSHDAANRRVLDNLGSPRAARRQFRRKHLTDRDRAYLREIADVAAERNVVFVPYYLALFSLLAVFFYGGATGGLMVLSPGYNICFACAMMGVLSPPIVTKVLWRWSRPAACAASCTLSMSFIAIGILVLATEMALIALSWLPYTLSIGRFLYAAAIGVLLIFVCHWLWLLRRKLKEVR